MVSKGKVIMEEKVTTKMSDSSIDEKKAKIFVLSASLAIPIVVTILHFMPKIEAGSGVLRSFLNTLPTFNAIINGTTALVLILAFVAIKNKNIQLHKRLMTSALVLSVLFLLSYVGYHSTSEHVVFPKDNPMRTTYLVILNSHIILSAIIVPLVLVTYSRALAKKFDKHKKIARITLPLWLYVTVTGVLVYLMISPYYSF
jgi:putative membrane protein